MYGFTIVLRKKNKAISGRNDFKKRERRRTASRQKKRILPFKISKLLPMIFLICAVLTAVFLPENKIEEGAENKKKKFSASELLNISKDDYSFYYIPIVLNDIENLEKNQDVTDEMISACCWSLIYDDDAKQKYECFDTETVIPKKDVEERFEKLFGKKLQFDNRSVDINGCKFEYKDENYVISITGTIPRFLPKLLKFESEPGKVVLTVGCLKSDEYVQDENANTYEPDPYKKLEITLSGDENDYCITKIKKL